MERLSDSSQSLTVKDTHRNQAKKIILIWMLDSNWNYCAFQQTAQYHMVVRSTACGGRGGPQSSVRNPLWSAEIAVRTDGCLSENREKQRSGCMWLWVDEEAWFVSRSVCRQHVVRVCPCRWKTEAACTLTPAECGTTEPTCMKTSCPQMARMSRCVFVMSVCVCVRACVRACVFTCRWVQMGKGCCSFMCVCVHACVCACVFVLCVGARWRGGSCFSSVYVYFVPVSVC